MSGQRVLTRMQGLVVSGLAGTSIAVVDDDPVYAAGLVAVLENLGCDAARAREPLTWASQTCRTRSGCGGRRSRPVGVAHPVTGAPNAEGGGYLLCDGSGRGRRRTGRARRWRCHRTRGQRRYSRLSPRPWPGRVPFERDRWRGLGLDEVHAATAVAERGAPCDIGVAGPRGQLGPGIAGDRVLASSHVPAREIAPGPARRRREAAAEE